MRMHIVHVHQLRIRRALTKHQQRLSFFFNVVMDTGCVHEATGAAVMSSVRAAL